MDHFAVFVQTIYRHYRHEGWCEQAAVNLTARYCAVRPDTVAQIVS
jgi:hypothetical protein